MGALLKRDGNVTDRKAKERRLALVREKRIRKARKSLWEYCRLESPDFYTADKWHLQLNCWVLQALYERTLTKEAYIAAVQEIAPAWFMDELAKPLEVFGGVSALDRLEDGRVYSKLMQNLPPRMGKSRTLVNFCKWALGQSITNKIITASYNDDMAQDFSRYTRDGIDEPKTYPHEINYADVFPGTKVKEGNASYKQWALDGNFFNYKGVGVNGGVTGKGCNISIVDDPVKDAEEAFNELALAKIWRWYTGTFKSRAEEGAIEIVNMTRWAKGDLCGHLLNDDQDEAKEWFVFLLEAHYEGSDQYLCEALLSRTRYKSLKRITDEAIFEANYKQRPVDLKGRLYKEFKTYTDVPRDEQGNPLFERIIAYSDTADTGSDYLCTPVAGIYQGELYMLDVQYTKEGMEVTEPETAALLVRNEVNVARVESNSGGRGFARNVERILWEKHNTKRVQVKWFHQTKNKIARIRVNATFIMQHVYFPVNWKDRWPEYYKAMTEYKAEGKNKNDDAPDATTGLVEMMDMDGKKIKAAKSFM